MSTKLSTTINKTNNKTNNKTINKTNNKRNSKIKKVIIIKTTISDSELTEAFSHLTQDDIRRITTEEIAKHFGKYFGMLIIEAEYGDKPGFTIINSKYNN